MEIEKEKSKYSLMEYLSGKLLKTCEDITFQLQRNKYNNNGYACAFLHDILFANRRPDYEGKTGIHPMHAGNNLFLRGEHL